VQRVSRSNGAFGYAPIPDCFELKDRRRASVYDKDGRRRLLLPLEASYKGMRGFDDLPNSEVGIGHEVERLLRRDDAKQQDHLVEQGWTTPDLRECGRLGGEGALRSPHE
jgi:hypothetical protein